MSVLPDKGCGWTDIDRSISVAALYSDGPSAGQVDRYSLTSSIKEIDERWRGRGGEGLRTTCVARQAARGDIGN